MMRITLALAAAVCLASSAAVAATDALPPPDLEWSFEGPLGIYDRGALKRGLTVYREVCELPTR